MTSEAFPGRLRIVFAGTDDRRWSNTMRRCEWFRRLGHEVHYVSVALPYTGRYDPRRILSQRLVSGPAFRVVNRKLLDLCYAVRPDLVWVDKGWTVRPETVQTIHTIGGPTVVSHLNDTPFTLRRQERRMWRFFKTAIPFYDVHFVSQRFQIEQFFAAGACRVFRFMHGVDPAIHRPQAETEAAEGAKGSVVFVGNCEPDRVPLMEALIKVFGHRVKVYGPNWNRFASPSLRRSGCVQDGPLVERHYAATLGAAACCIGLLSFLNQDLITRRSYEIPACGGCFIGQRTVDHQVLLREGVESLLWTDTSELIAQIRSVLDDGDLQRRLRAGGLQRAQALGFGYDRRIPNWLNFIFADRPWEDELQEVTRQADGRE